VVTKPAHQEVPAGADFSIQIDAFDPEGLPLSYSATNLPPGLGIDSATGLISGFIPGEESGIDYHVSVHVSDGERTRTVKFWIDIL